MGTVNIDFKEINVQKKKQKKLSSKLFLSLTLNFIVVDKLLKHNTCFHYLHFSAAAFFILLPVTKLRELPVALTSF